MDTPCCSLEITYKEEYLVQLGTFLASLKNIKALDVLPYHDMAISKYDNLGMTYQLKDVSPLTHEEALKARDIIISTIKKEKRTKNCP